MAKLSLRNVKIGWKYGIVFIFLFILFALSAFIVTKQIQIIGEEIERVERRGTRALQIAELGSLSSEKFIRFARFSYEGKAEFLEEFEDRSTYFIMLEEMLRESMVGVATEEEFANLDEIKKADLEINSLLNKIEEAVNAGDTEATMLYLEEGYALLEHSNQETMKLIPALNEQQAEAISDAMRSKEVATTVLISAIVLSIIIGGILVFLISRMVSRHLNRVIDISRQVADGNLNVNMIEYDGNDEVSQLGQATNTMITNLRTIISQTSKVSETVNSRSEELNQAANEVNTGTEQVASTMQELTSGAETQANSAVNLTSTMESFLAKIEEANINGEVVSKSSTEVLAVTKNGGQLMEQSVQQMNVIDQIVKDAVQKVKGLDSQTQEISKLVAVINDIAGQTNLLALNAAIEAARAGEHGKGFAVVADEVRKLAEQVSESVSDITTIVSNIQLESTAVATSLQGGYQEVEKGTSQIKTTGETFTEINQSIKQMVQNIETITNNLTNMTEQSEKMKEAIEGISEVSEEAVAGIEQTAASTEQTSSSMEEVAKSSEELSKLAEILNELVQKFKL
ncbi:methyl-accepting chemotaxis protein [Bacillus sp. JCM 19034]|uniref:methyl-accepting chemotaxis protein n=1 Tax=Bacillus sp. JCM 19034 TaxID=1481928 RepID=UPI000784CD89|nr:HAMP domain-containing methyl-accepting chemotaxis protein [Bacillus sp. JCM 19034]